jgi:hypothetical protein
MRPTSMRPTSTRLRPLTSAVLTALGGLATRLTPWLIPAGLLALAACGGAEASEAGLIVRPDPAQQVPEGGKPRPEFHDFGNVAFGTTFEHTFVIDNRDRGPVRVLRALPSCSCTVPGLVAFGPDGVQREADPADPDALIRIPEGGRLELTLRITTHTLRETNIDKLVTVRLQTDSNATPFLTLEAHFKVPTDFRIVPEVADFKSVPRTTGKSLQVEFFPTEHGQLELVSVEHAPAGLTVELFPNELAGGGAMSVLLHLAADLPAGPRRGQIKFRTRRIDGEPGPLLDLEYRALVRPDLYFEPPHVLLLPTPEEPGLGQTVAIGTHRERFAFRVDAVSAEGEHSGGFEIEVEPVGTVFESGAAGRWYVHVHWPAERFPDPRPESIAGELVVRFGPEDDLEPMRIPYAGLFR